MSCILLLPTAVEVMFILRLCLIQTWNKFHLLNKLQHNQQYKSSPTCGRGRNNNWVHAHWYEEGTWSGNSQGIEADMSPLHVQGQTRFWVDDDLKIREIVITRTFSRWEESLIKAQLS